MKNLFPVFRAGKYPQGEYTEEDVKDLFEKYDPDFLSAPFTVDHKKDGPAYGYAKVLKFKDGKLFASKEDLAPNMREAIKNKHFRRVSIEVYKDLPDVDGKYLAAISFLGVKAPQVKGLEGGIEEAQFRDEETESIEFEVNWEEDSEEFELADVEDDDQQDQPDEDTEEEKPTDDSDTDSEEETDEGDDTESEEEEDTDTESYEDLQAKINTLEEEKENLTEKFETSEQERERAQDRLEEISLNQRRLKFEQFLNERVAYGNLKPANKEKVMDLLLALDGVEKFEHEEPSTDDEPVEVFKEFLESRGKIVDDDEVATKETDTEEFEDYSHELAARAREYREKQADDGKVISFAEAVTAVEKQRNQ